jgi:hypothetical protein
VKHTVPTLLAIAAFAPGLAALDVKDDDMKLGLTLQLQLRADMSTAETAAGADYDVMTGNANSGDTVDFYNRRLRFGLKGVYKNDYKFSVVFAADKGQAKDKAVTLYEATVTRVLKDEANNLTHEFRAGLANAFFSGAVGSYSSTAYLLPGIRGTEALGTYRGNGIAYMLTAPMGRFGIDIQNNINDDISTTASDGMFYSTRAEISLPGEWNIAKPTESFQGKTGKGVLGAVDYMTNVRAGNTTTTTGYGFELLAHFDAVTALAEYRATSTEVSTTNTTTKASVWLVQAGYAMPLGDAIIEPAIRYQVIDLNSDNDKEGLAYSQTSGSGKALDYGTSGNQIDIGVNYYISGNNNKIQVAYTMWEGEENTSGDKATADILRAQWQLWF